MRYVSTLTFLAFATAAPAHAEPLWQQVEAGMSVAQLHALFPEAKDRVKWKASSIEIRGALQVGKCAPKVIVYHGKGAVERVETGMVPLGLKATCTDEAYQLMLAKYGKPNSEIEAEKESLGGTEYKNVVTTWLRPGVVIVMDRDTGYYDDRWWVTYKPLVTDSGL